MTEAEAKKLIKRIEVLERRLYKLTEILSLYMTNGNVPTPRNTDGN